MVIRINHRKSKLVCNKQATHEFSRLTCNLLPAGIRLDKMEDRDYTVVPMVMLTEGVHEGSQGPLFYPKEELGKTPVVWNHKPIVVYHPTMNGEGVTACDPAMITSRKIGVIMNTQLDGQGRLKAEAWIERDRANKVDPRIMEAVDNAKLMELSTGVFIDVEDTEGKWKDEDYQGIARNFRPDHLALLPDQIGACSTKDGAGFIRNQAGKKKGFLNFLRSLWEESETTEEQVTKNDSAGDSGFLVKDDKGAGHLPTSKNGKPDHSLMGAAWAALHGGYRGNKYAGPDKAGAISRLKALYKREGMTPPGSTNNKAMDKTKITNEIIAANKGWGEDDRDTLMALNDQQLTLIHNASKGNATDTAPDADGDAEEDAATDSKAPVAKGKKGTKKGMAKNVKEGADSTPKEGDPDDEEDADEEAEEAPAGNVSLKEYIDQAPPEIQEVLTNGVSVYNEEKVRLIKLITQNKNNGFKQDDLKNKPLGELRMLARLAAPAAEVARAIRYDGQAPTENAQDGEEPALEIPAMNFTATSK